MNDSLVVTRFYRREKLAEDLMSLELSQMTELLAHHKLVEVSPRDVRSNHYNFLLPNDGLAERQDVRFLRQLVVDINFALNVEHQILFDDLLHAHALKYNDALGDAVASYCHYSNHSTTDEASDFELANLSVQSCLLLFFLKIAIDLLLLV